VKRARLAVSTTPATRAPRAVSRTSRTRRSASAVRSVAWSSAASRAHNRATLLLSMPSSRPRSRCASSPRSRSTRSAWAWAIDSGCPHGVASPASTPNRRNTCCIARRSWSAGSVGTVRAYHQIVAHATNRARQRTASAAAGLGYTSPSAIPMCTSIVTSSTIENGMWTRFQALSSALLRGASTLRRS
jgi:hypothetical protein